MVTIMSLLVYKYLFVTLFSKQEIKSPLLSPKMETLKELLPLNLLAKIDPLLRINPWTFKKFWV